MINQEPSPYEKPLVNEIDKEISQTQKETALELFRLDSQLSGLYLNV